MGLLCAWFLLLRPAAFGGPLSLVIVTGQSMEPTMHTGDLAIVMRQDTYEVGDVVAFHPQLDGAGSRRSMVIHRIVDGSLAAGFTTQGDGNDWLDPWSTPTEAVAGEMVFFIPGAGSLLVRLSDPLTLAALFAAGTVFVVVSSPKREEPRDEDRPAAWTAQATP